MLWHAEVLAVVVSAGAVVLLYWLLPVVLHAVLRVLLVEGFALDLVCAVG